MKKIFFSLLCCVTAVSFNGANLENANKDEKDLQSVLPVVAVNYVSQSNLQTRTIDKSLTVGSIDGTAGVGANGEATYAIAIPLPKGSGTMAPSLALNYNSSAGNGLFGVGWQLSGVSAISRTS